MLTIAPGENGALRLEFFGEISTWADGAYEAAVSDALRAHTGDVQVLINTPGGEVTAGLAIHGLLASYRKGTVTTHNIAQAASAGSLILAAGSVRKVSAGAVTMIHRASAGQGGNAEDLATAARMLEAFDRAQAAVLSGVTGKSVAEVDALLRKTEWMTAEQALALGLATEVVEMADITAQAPPVAPLHTSTPSATVPGMTVRKRLGLPESATEAEVTAALDAALAAKPTAQTPAPAPAPVKENSEPADLDERIAAAVAAALKAREVAAELAKPAPEPKPEGDPHAEAVAAVVDAAIAAGKIQPAARAKAIVACGPNAVSLNAMRQLWAAQASIVPAPGAAKLPASPAPTALTESQKLCARAAGLSDAEWLAARAKFGKV